MPPANERDITQVIPSLNEIEAELLQVLERHGINTGAFVAAAPELP